MNKLHQMMLVVGELERIILTHEINIPQGWLNAVNNELLLLGD